MEQRTISDGPEPNSAAGSPGLRERKRIRTKLMVQTEALRLFANKGYEQTTIDDIAHAAAMSPRTFFRYFPTKEDVVLWDEYDERPFKEIWRHRFADDPLAQLISVVRYTLADIYRKDPDLLLTRIKLSYAVPEIRARFLNEQINTIGPFFDELRDVLGPQPDDLRLPVTVAAIYGAILVAVERWQRNDGRDDLIELFDDAIMALAAGLADLRTAVHVAATAAPADNAAQTGPGARPDKAKAAQAKRNRRAR